MLEPLAPATPDQERALLEPLAARLIWWQSAEESLRQPDRVIAQVMDIGDFDSVLRLRQVLGDPRLAAVLRRAQPGWFSPRSWNYWHLKLGVATPGAVPPSPGGGCCPAQARALRPGSSQKLQQQRIQRLHQGIDHADAAPAEAGVDSSTAQALQRDHQIGLAELIQQLACAAHANVIAEAFRVDQQVGVERGAHQS